MNVDVPFEQGAVSLSSLEAEPQNRFSFVQNRDYC